MARRPRTAAPGAVLHLTARGILGSPIFFCEFDRFAFLALLRRVTERSGWTIVAWCLMDTHYHLIVVVPDSPRVAWAMQLLNGVYAREFNHRHGRRGHLFADRYTETLIGSDSHLEAACSYVFENPVRAGLVREAGKWPWAGDHRLEPRPVERIATKPSQSRDTLVRLAG